MTTVRFLWWLDVSVLQHTEMLTRQNVFISKICSLIDAFWQGCLCPSIHHTSSTNRLHGKTLLRWLLDVCACVSLHRQIKAIISDSVCWTFFFFLDNIIPPNNNKPLPWMQVPKVLVVFKEKLKWCFIKTWDLFSLYFTWPNLPSSLPEVLDLALL